ncbi:hypothetical protein ACRE_028280 [Hapsidospora chrysogenum ATCC 11550]|uniref:Uncharacterized protein n=1 Tax=Hapsidospora chrysogenum (strain ATCC 11550 / CBS 779.69 / DSM 880 / IAM 14645 / JCM 23072 / IMI 49137) TaxID=857340 RepID=A0A086TAE1_HAPC1|nr:hypothetical protein ACRE_028280 [Hapsidospora chrysogenum ATCC 11550]
MGNGQGKPIDFNSDEKEIREDTLYRTIENDFRPFDYTLAAYKKCVSPIDRPYPQNANSSRITEGAGLGEEPQHDVSNDGTAQAVTTDETRPAHDLTAAQQEMTSGEHRSGVDGKPIRPNRPAPPLPTAYQTDYTRKASRSSSNRITSPTGGVQVTLDGGGSWSDLARQDATLPTDANTVAEGKGEGSGGMFGFLKSKKGRNHSPRPKERGVLGKEGARVVIG